MPPGKVFKAVWKTGRVVRKGFKFAKYGRKHLHAIANGLEAGLKADLDGAIIKITKNGDEIGSIKNGGLVPNKYGSSGTPMGDPNGGYQLYKNGDNYHYKRTPDVSGYSQSDLTKLTEHPNAHVLERHGHDVSDEALIKRANTGIAPDGSIIGNPANPYIPPLSSKFDSPSKLKQALYNTQPGTPAFANRIPNQYPNGYDVFYQLPNGSYFGKGAIKNTETFQNLSKVLASYEETSPGVFKLVTMYPIN